MTFLKRGQKNDETAARRSSSLTTHGRRWSVPAIVMSATALFLLVPWTIAEYKDLAILKESPVSSTPAPTQGKIVFATVPGDINGFELTVSGDEVAVDGGIAMPNTGLVSSPALSPDGGQLAYTMTRDNNSDIFVVNLDGSSLQEVTTTSATDETGPEWSPDGQSLAFERNDDTGLAEVVIKVLATGDEVQVTKNEVLDSQPTWSPDGSRIIFTGVSRAQSDLWEYEVATAMTRQLTDTPEQSEAFASFSPDGGMIAYTVWSEADSATAGDIHTMHLSSMRHQRLSVVSSGADLCPRWLNNDLVAFVRIRDGGGHDLISHSRESGAQSIILRNVGIPFDWRAHGSS